MFFFYVAIVINFHSISYFDSSSAIYVYVSNLKCSCVRDCPAVTEEKVLNVHVLYHGHILDKINISHSCETLQAHKTKLFKSISGIAV